MDEDLDVTLELVDNANLNTHENTNDEISQEEYLNSSNIIYESTQSVNNNNSEKLLYTGPRYAHSTLLPVVKQRKVVQWRMKDKMKTVSVALTLCLNLGVDPPDIIKTNPCARLEAWIDPLSLPPTKGIDSVVKNLQVQYERWQPRARYKSSLDPTPDDIKKLCTSLRRTAKDERILFHYNGHGVPKPTQNGEIWAFNKNFTQYIPLSLYELQTCLGNPSIYVFDCSSAGTIIHWFNKFADQKELELEKARKKSNPLIPTSSNNNSNSTSKTNRDYILLGACSSGENLPSNPVLPADVFTSCLTTPIKIGLKWFCSQTIVPNINPEITDKIPGKVTDRRTPLGELNWIFTAITDTIAWNVLPQELFQKLFRQDLLVACLFRNFLIAERIMRSYKCTPVSHPKLPSTYNHPMWLAWDLAVDHALVQLPQLIADPNYEYQHSSFFTEQLTAFEVWLQFGTEDKNPPEQLPIVLQVLLSQQHRLRALELLGKFLDLGPWAVNQALSVGIFPYVLKLLQSPASELRKILIFIWAKILALDQSCQLDLVKDNGQHYFVNVLSNHKIPSEQRQQAAFILSVICNNCRPGQSACLNARLMQICLANLVNPDPLLRRWVVLCLAKLWENHEEGKRVASKENAHEKLCGLLTDPVPEVRAASVYALGTFIGRSGSNLPNREQRTFVELNLGLTFAVVTADSSPLVRKELVIALWALISTYEDKFKTIEKNIIKLEIADRQKKKKPGSSDTDSSLIESPSPDHSTDTEENGIYDFLWKSLVLPLSNDPFPLVAQMASNIVKKIRDQVCEELKIPIVTLPTVNVRAPVASEESSQKSIRSITSFFRPSSTQPMPGPQPRPPQQVSVPVVTTEKYQVDETRSTLYDWFSNSFSQPFSNKEEIDETSPSYNDRKNKLQRNNDIIDESLKRCKEQVQKLHTLENEIAILENDNQMVSHLKFHPFDSLIIVTDEHDGISIWNWENGTLVSDLSNRNPTGTHITSLELLNEHDSALVAVGADDGVIRIWGGIQRTDSVHLVTSWRAINLEAEHTAGAGLVVEWQPKNDTVIASGNIDVLKVWDINRELCVQDIPTNCTSCVTCLTSDKSSDGSKLIIAGCWDGSVRLFDRRQNAKFAHLVNLQEHKGFILNVSMPQFLDQQIISGSASGEVKFWDLRNTKTSLKSFTGRKGEHPLMTALAVHNCVPLLAVGQDQKIKVMNFEGDILNVIRYHDGFLGQRIGPISSLCFHPYKIILAAGATDSIVSVYTGEQHKIKN